MNPSPAEGFSLSGLFITFYLQDFFLIRTDSEHFNLHVKLKNLILDDKKGFKMFIVLLSTICIFPVVMLPIGAFGITGKKMCTHHYVSETTIMPSPVLRAKCIPMGCENILICRGGQPEDEQSGLPMSLLSHTCQAASHYTMKGSSRRTKASNPQKLLKLD